MPPGSLITVIVGGEPNFEIFADLPGMIDPASAVSFEAMTTAAVLDRFDELLQASVQGMLFADAPVGALCSGGVESSLLMALAARTHDQQRARDVFRERMGRAPDRIHARSIY